MKKKYQVFVSSTYEDLKEERKAVYQCLLENDCFPVGMESFPASSMTQMEYITKMLKECDYYLLILAQRYGSIAEDGLSYTEKEYNYADEIGIPILTFVSNETNEISIDKTETDTNKIECLKKFRDRVCKNRLVKFYSDINELKSHISTSINKCIRDFPSIGCIREENEIYSSKEIKITPKTSTYVNVNQQGHFTFDYSNNNGEYTIGQGDYTFITKWSKASNTSIHTYNDGTGIDSIALIKNIGDIKNITDIKGDFSSRVRSPSINDAVIWKNKNGKYAITKVLAIKDDSRGAEHDELTCEYVIFDEMQDNNLPLVTDQQHISGELIKRLLELIKENPSITRVQLSAKLGISRQTITRALQTLLRQRIIKRIGSDKTTHWQVIEKNK